MNAAAARIGMPEPVRAIYVAETWVVIMKTPAPPRLRDISALLLGRDG